jgi:hypothetical protein
MCFDFFITILDNSILGHFCQTYDSYTGAIADYRWQLHCTL